MPLPVTLLRLAPYRLRDFIAFESSGAQFLYLVPSGAIFASDAIGREIIDELSSQVSSREETLRGSAAGGAIRHRRTSIRRWLNWKRPK